MSRPASPVFPVDDPAGTAWMRGITPTGLGLVFALCAAITISNPDLWDLGFRSISTAARWAFRTSSVFFISALPMYVMVVRTEMATSNLPPRRRIALLMMAVLAGALLFPFIRLGLRFGQAPLIGTAAGYWQNPVGHFFRALGAGALLTSVLYFTAREKRTTRLLQRARLARGAIERQMSEARLQLLQAQIEPHFLFNSLASVKRLYEKEPGQGRSLLRNLGDYLRMAISRARLREARLGEEMALARSFLAIFQVRMGARLTVRIDLPAELGTALVPPLMLGTLVENAIKHGIGPRASGGTVSVTARRRAEVLELEVSDDGVGFRARSGHGVGLANVRARLETLFEEAASLELASRAGGGVTATMRLPLRLTVLAQA